MSKSMKFLFYFFSIPMINLFYFGVVIVIIVISMGTSVSYTLLQEYPDLYATFGMTLILSVSLLVLFILLMLIFVKNIYVQSTFFGFTVGLLINLGRVFLYPSYEIIFYIASAFTFLILGILAKKKFSLSYLYSIAFSSLLFYVYLH